MFSPYEPVNCLEKPEGQSAMVSKARTEAATPVAELETDGQSAHRLADLLEETFGAQAPAVSLVDNGHGRWRVTIHFRGALERDRLREMVARAAGHQAAGALTFGRIATRDWVSESLAGLRPVTAGRFVVHGGHDRATVPLNRIGIEIEAALAFGTGHHGTTRGCLLALDEICKTLSKRPTARLRILDLGTGSGLLAIAAARALRRPVLATDIDGVAVRAARGNARLNRAGALVEVVKADGVCSRRLRERGPFDIVFANILLGPLQRLAIPLLKITAPRAHLVLSGITVAQANAALASYRGLVLRRRFDLDGWTTLVLARPPAVAGGRGGP